ncbi:transferrin 2 [Centruroides vittatus]|uniref:transferrin 2 n=1 Tax=Centruroides vittatus TaxID=120091 RepID=UPI003510B946
MYLFFVCLSLSIIFDVLAQNVQTEDKLQITWCTISHTEQEKCQKFASAVERADWEEREKFNVKLLCKEATDKDQCMGWIEGRKADVVTLDPGELSVAGRYHSLVPIVAERYGPEETDGYYAVAVTRISTRLDYLRDLEGKRVCFPSVGQLGGWIIPMARLIEEDVLPIKYCNNIIKSAAEFFGPSCAPNSLIDKYNPTGDNPEKMCELCEGKKSNRCSGNNKYANFEGAFNCLLNNGEVAFLKDSTVREMTSQRNYRGPPASEFKLVCPFNRRETSAPVDDFRSCNWGYVPAHVVAVSSVVLPETRKKYQRFLERAVKLFGRNNLYSSNWNADYPPHFNASYRGSSNYYPYNRRSLSSNSVSEKSFQLFKSGTGDDRDPYKNSTNLLFLDTTTNLVALDASQQIFVRYLGTKQDLYKKLQKCPVPPAKLCVVSVAEQKKCNKMRTAFRAKTLKPDLVCITGHSQRDCMQLIKNGQADLTMLDAGDIYHAGHAFGLIPIIAEQYDLQEPAYYVVAVAQQPDKDTDLLYLKGKRSCHTGVGLAAGWVIPMSFLLSNERMRSYGCNSAHAAAEFFQKSCIPGVLSKEYTVADWSYANLCDLCHGTGASYCSRDSSEPFYGNTGALRCLVEGGGEIAFVKHTTVLENTAGKNREWWARPMMPGDFELLCRDGTRAKQHEYESCNLGKVASNAMVTNRKNPYNVTRSYIDLFLHAQQYYGSKYSEDFTFKMFVSDSSYNDLIFQDATQQLVEVPLHKHNYHEYLGYDFVQAMKIVDCRAAASSIELSLSLISILSLLIFNWQL